jgi:hypothetical protein
MKSLVRGSALTTAEEIALRGALATAECDYGTCFMSFFMFSIGQSWDGGGTETSSRSCRRRTHRCRMNCSVTGRFFLRTPSGPRRGESATVSGRIREERGIRLLLPILVRRPRYQPNYRAPQKHWVLPAGDTAGMLERPIHAHEFYAVPGWPTGGPSLSSLLNVDKAKVVPARSVRAGVVICEDGLLLFHFDELLCTCRVDRVISRVRATARV